MPIDFPLGTFRDGRIVGYRLTAQKHYLILSQQEADAIEGIDLDEDPTAHRARYWGFMARQLRKLGIAATPETAWRLFAD